jgi:hypothetical protein
MRAWIRPLAYRASDRSFHLPAHARRNPSSNKPRTALLVGIREQFWVDPSVGTYGTATMSFEDRGSATPGTQKKIPPLSRSDGRRVHLVSGFRPRCRASGLQCRASCRASVSCRCRCRHQVCANFLYEVQDGPPSGPHAPRPGARTLAAPLTLRDRVLPTGARRWREAQ